MPLVSFVSYRPICVLQETNPAPRLSKVNIVLPFDAKYHEFYMGSLRVLLRTFIKSESGQGIAEYCLMTAALALLGLGLYLHACGGLDTILARK